MPHSHVLRLSSSMGFVPILESLRRHVVGMDRQNPGGNNSASGVPRSGESILLRPVWNSQEPCRTGLVSVSLSHEQYSAQPPQLLLVRKDDPRVEETIYGPTKNDKAGLKRTIINECLLLITSRKLATIAGQTFTIR